MITLQIKGDHDTFLSLQAVANSLEAPTHEEWLAARQGGIGGSDAPVVLDQSPWKSPLELWGEKIGRLTPAKLESDAVEMGKLLEPVVIQRFQQKSGLPAWCWPGTLSVLHEDYPWQFATPDAVIFDPSRGVGLGQIKTTDRWGFKHWSDGPPIYHQIQLQHEIAACNAEWGMLIVLVDGRQLHWFLQERNEAFIDQMRDTEESFWRCCVNETPPEIGSSGAAKVKNLGKVLSKLFDKETGDQILLDQDSNTWDAELQSIKSALKTLTDEKDLLESRIKAAIGNATVGMLPSGVAYSWSTTERRAYEVAATSYRTLRRIESQTTKKKKGK